MSFLNLEFLCCQFIYSLTKHCFHRGARAVDSPVLPGLLTSQLSGEPDSNLCSSKPSPSSPSAGTQVQEDDDEDDDILPPSPVPVSSQPRQAKCHPKNQQQTLLTKNFKCRRTPVTLSRSSAFVTMAIGSPVQGSLRTLRNIEEIASSTVPDKVDDSSNLNNDNVSKEVKEVRMLLELPQIKILNCSNENIFIHFQVSIGDCSLGTSPSKSKSMRQIHFESDSGSNQSVVMESPSSFLSEPNRGFDNSIQKPTVSRPAEPSEEADDGIEFVEEVKRRVRQDSNSPQSSVAISAAQPRRDEADSASQGLTPRLNRSPSLPYSQELLSTSPFRDPDSQSHRFVECFQTQDILTRTEPSMDEADQDSADRSLIADPSSEAVTSKLELSVELCAAQELPSSQPTLVDDSVPTTITLGQPIEASWVKSEGSDHRDSNDSTQQISSQEVNIFVVISTCIFYVLEIRLID